MESQRDGAVFMYAVGSKVVHSFHGAGTIVSIQQKRIDDKSRTYYVIDLVGKPMQLMVPVKLAEDGRLRPVGKQANLRRVLAARCGAPAEEEIPQDYRARKKVMSARLKSGSFEEVVSAVSALFLLRSRRSRGMTDRRMLADGKDLLAGELALTSGLELSEAMETIEESLAQMLTTIDEA